MNKTELIVCAAEKAMVPKKEADAVINAALESIISELASGGKVQLVGFGSFEVRKRSERMGRDPRTNTPMKLPASKGPAFRPGKSFKEAVNK